MCIETLKHYNMKNTSKGQSAYIQARKNGASKEEAKQAKTKATENHFKSISDNQMKYAGQYRPDVDFTENDSVTVN